MRFISLLIYFVYLLFCLPKFFCHFSHLEIEKLSFWVVEKDSTEKVTNWSSAQDNFSFLCLTLFAFGFQEIVPNFPCRNRIFRPLKLVQQKWWSKAWRFPHEWKMLGDALATILAFPNSTQGYSTFGSDLTLLASFLVWFRRFTRKFSAIDSNHVEGSL